MNARFSLGPLGCPQGVEPREWRQAIGERLEELHDAMLALVAALDAMDGDPDLEPSLGAAESSPGRSWLGECGDQTEWARTGTDGREAEDEHGGDILDVPHGDPREDNEDGGDKEPSMGWGNIGGQTHRQEGWDYHALGRNADRED